MRLTILMLATLIALPVAADDRYAGRWVVNIEETQAVAVPFKKGGGLDGSKWSPGVTVMGLPVPGTQRMRPMSSLPAKQPMVLRCAAMIVTRESGRMEVDYPGIGNETLREGHYRGRDTRISKKRIQQKYKTPERKVTKTWSIRDDGRLLVEVRIKPVNDRSRLYRRVFDRAPLEDPGPAEPAPAESASGSQS